MTAIEYISSGAIEACILGVATTAEMQEYTEKRLLWPEVKAYADAFELDLEKNLVTNSNFIEAGKLQFLETISVKEAPVVSINSSNKKKFSYGIAAGFALLLGSLLFNFMQLQRLKEQQATITDLQKAPNTTVASNNFDFLKNPEITPVALNGVGIHAICRCSLYWDKNKKKAYFQIHHLVPPGANRGYQLWAIVNNKPVSVGMVPFNTNKEPVSMANVPADATGFAVTNETETGATTPNKDIFLQGTV